MIEYQATMPPSTPSARSSAAIDPSSNRMSGYESRATAIIAGERSTPNTFRPSDDRNAATRPGPATEVGNEPVACVVHELREHAEHRPIDRLVLELVAEERGVVDGDRVVGNARRAQVARLGHAADRTGRVTHSLGSRTCPSSKKR